MWFKPQKTYSAGQLIDCGAFQLRLKVNLRARRISLRLDNKTGEAIATAPRVRDLPQAVDFALSRSDWIAGHVASRPGVQPFQPDMDIPFRGRSLRLTRSQGRAAAQLEGDRLSAGGEGAAYHRRIERFLRLEAMRFAEHHTALYAQKLGFSGVRVSLIDPKGRWGSCTPGRKSIRYSWRLIMAPDEVFAYVCAHEAAHLRHPHHGPAFWAEVETLYGPYAPFRQWLKREGQNLFVYAPPEAAISSTQD
ncbi:MAG: SprT family zinc-dependent metalloprotease [Asticcacaulis sp.]